MTKSNRFLGRATELDWVALTVSPPISKQSLKHQVDKWSLIFSKLQSNFILIPEFAINDSYELRLHFHGVICNSEHLHTDLRYLAEIVFIKHKQIKDMKGWQKYCIKEINKTKRLFGVKKREDIMIDYEFVKNKTTKLSTQELVDFMFGKSLNNEPSSKVV